MKDIRNLKGTSLRWFRQGWARGNYELMGKEDADTYAKLDWKGIFTEKASATTAYGDFDLTWRGVLRRHVPIIDTASNQEIGRLRLGFKDSGVMELDNGRKYRFKCTSIWKSTWVFLDDVGETVCSVGFTGLLHLRRMGGEVEVWPSAPLGRDLLLMMIVGWYAAVVINQENSMVYPSTAG